LLEGLADHLGEEQLYIYGDSGYPLKRHLITPHQGVNLTEQQISYNQIMSKMRVCVEWEFGELYEQFAFLAFKMNQKLLLQPVNKYFVVACILKNCQTCLYGCQISIYFNVSPPSVERYIKNDPDM
jgi:hypothetical protein